MSTRSDIYMRTLVCILCAVWNMSFYTALAFTGTVKFDRKDGNNIVIQAGGLAAKAKEAREEAVMNAFKALLYEGIPGLNDGVPLLIEKNKSFDYRFFDTQYTYFLTSTPITILEEKVQGQRHALMEVIINVEKLKKAAVSGGCTLYPQWKTNNSDNVEVAANTYAVKPSIIVIPYMADTDADFEAMVEYVTDNPIARSAVNAVSTHFGKMGYPTKDFVTLLQNSKTSDLTSSGTQTDIMTELVRQLPGDIVVTVKAAIDTKGESSQCTLNLKAVERHTGHQLAMQDFTSGRYRNADREKLVAHAVDKMPSDFVSQLDDSFRRRIDEGLTLVVELQLSSSVDDWNFDTPIPASGDDFKTWLGGWMREHSQNNSYVRPAATDKYIQNTIKIPLIKLSDGYSYGPDEFASELKKAVREVLDDEYGVKVTEMGQKLIVTIE